jgi:hypothetical protein
VQTAAIHLHVGAHKTATSYIQAQLQNNRDTLRTSEVAFVPTREFRRWRVKTVRECRGNADALSARFDAFFTQHANAARTLLLSDENMIGTCEQIAEHGSLYPDVLRKLGHVAMMLRGYEVRLLMSLRSYDAFYAAALCEAARGGRFISFADFSRRLDVSARRWPDVLNDIAQLFPASQFSVWPYELFRQRPLLIMEEMVGQTLTGRIHLADETIRRSPSHQAMTILEHVGDWAPKLIGRGAVSWAEAVAGLSSRPRPYSPWPEEARDRLRALYVSDLETIHRDSRYKVLVDPDSSSETLQVDAG